MSRPLRIALLTPLELEYSGRLLEGAAQFAKEHPEVTLIDLPYSVEAPNSLTFSRTDRFDGAVVWATHEARWVERLTRDGVPLISCSTDLLVRSVPCIAFSSEVVVDRALEHLAALRPAMVVNLEFRIAGIPAMEQRTHVFAERARALGLEVRTAQILRRDGKDDSPSARRRPLAGGAARRMRSMLRALPRPAAIWCGDDLLAEKVCAAAREVGLRLPQDLAVLGLGGFRVASVHQPTISTMPLPGELIGYRAIAHIFGRARRFLLIPQSCRQPS